MLRLKSIVSTACAWLIVLWVPASVPAGQASTAPGPTASAAALPAPPLRADQVLVYLRRTLDWYGESEAVAQIPQLSADVVVQDRVHDAALDAVRKAFEFARAAAEFLRSSAPGAKSSSGAGVPQTALGEASARLAQRIAALAGQLAQLDAKLARAAAHTRAALAAQRADVSAALDFEREAQSTVESLERFQSSEMAEQASGARDLSAQIDELERSVPEASEEDAARAGSPPPASAALPARARAASVVPASTAATGAASSFRPESAGIVALVSESFSLMSAERQLRQAIRSTDALSDQAERLRTPLIDQLRALVGSSLTQFGTSGAAGMTTLAAARTQLEKATARFKHLAALLVPLREEEFLLTDARSALSGWRVALDGRLATVERYLLAQAGVLLALIATVLVVSEVWRRAVFRYLHDARRRNQFQTLRRVVIGAALVVVVLFTLVSEVGSLATYAGFVTAGLAVALQNVILSVVAYFFLIGRYGVRVGDRITLAGVTGRVADIGLVRIYIMELGGADLHSTGRMVVLSNSVIFQPQALYKQIPGADYLWHTVSLTLGASVDVQAARTRLKSTADAVYEQYRPAIEQQHASVQRLLGFETAVPVPEVRVRFAQAGMQFDVRYPVQAEHAATFDHRMLRALRDALDEEPKLALVESGEPALKTVEA